MAPLGCHIQRAINRWGKRRAFPDEKLECAIPFHVHGINEIAVNGWEQDLPTSAGGPQSGFSAATPATTWFQKIRRSPCELSRCASRCRHVRNRDF
jgi:hypothetical protein